MDMGVKKEGYFLEDFPGAGVAFSDRQLAASVTGGTVRRTSDEVTNPIVFGDDKKPDQSVLDSFAGVNSLAIAQFNDQTGNGFHATSPSSGQEPLLYNSGSIVTTGTEPSMSLDGSNDFFQNTSYSTPISSPFTTIVVASNSRTVDTNQVLLEGAASGNFPGFPGLTQLYMDNNQTRIRAIFGTYNAPGDDFLCMSPELSVIAVVRKANNLLDAYDSNGVKLLSNIDNGTAGYKGLRAGSKRDSPGYYWQGSINTVINYQSDQTANIQSMITSLKNLYDI